MRREVRATANRLANFDDANLRRSALAAVAAGARVERALEILGDEVPDHLRLAGALRLEHRQASLEELGGLGRIAVVQGHRGGVRQHREEPGEVLSLVLHVCGGPWRRRRRRRRGRVVLERASAAIGDLESFLAFGAGHAAEPSTAENPSCIMT